MSLMRFQIGQFAWGAAAWGLALLFPGWAVAADGAKPNIILLMTDDQGWGDTGYNSGGKVKTPNLDAMAANGVIFTSFYAAYPNCSPTRASVLTGRHPARMGVFTHGGRLPESETTLAEILKKAGYRTGHFGKWHLQGVGSGPGAPVSMDSGHPGKHGFDTWCSATNYIDLNPNLRRQDGSVARLKGDSSDAIMTEALKFIEECKGRGEAFLAVIWYGSPHNPHKALPEDREKFGDDYFGEIGAMDRSVGALRVRLREWGMEKNTMLWFTSDNGSLESASTGGLRGTKGTIWEGGVRVPGIVELPVTVEAGSVCRLPSGSVDILPTVCSFLGIRVEGARGEIDGIDLMPAIRGEAKERANPLFFWNLIAAGGKGLTGPTHAAVIDGAYKLHVHPSKRGAGGAGKLPEVMLINLENDAAETRDIAVENPDMVARMRKELEAWQESVRKDYGRLRQ